MLIRLATLDDLSTLKQLKQDVWPDQTSNTALISATLQTADSVTFIGLIDDNAAGFVSCFPTAASGERRWEVDLLAVHPDFRRLGLARMLIENAVGAGREMKTTLARALIAVDNVGSQRTFARNGFRIDDSVSELYIGKPSSSLETAKPNHVHLLRINTFNYQGIWVEGLLSTQALKAAQAECQEQGLDLVGAIIGQDDEEGQEAAQQCGFDAVGCYQQWICRF